MGHQRSNNGFGFLEAAPIPHDIAVALAAQPGPWFKSIAKNATLTPATVQVLVNEVVQSAADAAALVGRDLPAETRATILAGRWAKSATVVAKLYSANRISADEVEPLLAKFGTTRAVTDAVVAQAALTPEQRLTAGMSASGVAAAKLITDPDTDLSALTDEAVGNLVNRAAQSVTTFNATAGPPRFAGIADALTKRPGAVAFVDLEAPGAAVALSVAGAQDRTQELLDVTIAGANAWDGHPWRDPRRWFVVVAANLGNDPTVDGTVRATARRTFADTRFNVTPPTTQHATTADQWPWPFDVREHSNAEPTADDVMLWAQWSTEKLRPNRFTWLTFSTLCDTSLVFTKAQTSKLAAWLGSGQNAAELGHVNLDRLSDALGTPVGRMGPRSPRAGKFKPPALFRKNNGLCSRTWQPTWNVTRTGGWASTRTTRGDNPDWTITERISTAGPEMAQQLAEAAGHDLERWEFIVEALNSKFPGTVRELIDTMNSLD